MFLPSGVTSVRSASPAIRSSVHLRRAVRAVDATMLARTVQGLLLLGTRMFQQGNRNLLGLVMVFMAKDLGFGVGERGSLLSAIAAGYFFTQIPGGALADKMGAKLVMCAAAAAAAARCSHLRTAELVCVCVGKPRACHC